jgi:hypothetical protein
MGASEGAGVSRGWGVEMTRSVHIVLAVVLFGGALTACTGGSEERLTPIQGSSATARSETARPDLPTAVVVKEWRDFSLNTHCGVRDARIGGEYYLADPALTDGLGNPPREWLDFGGVGVMTVYSDGTAKFTDGQGHDATFTKLTEMDGYRLCA